MTLSPPEHLDSKAYKELVDIVANEPGAEVDELEDSVNDADNIEIDIDVSRYLEAAVNQGDISEADDKFWVMRKGRYAFNAEES